MIYIVISYYKDKINKRESGHMVESVWDSPILAEAAVKYYESLHKVSSYRVIERHINAITKVVSDK